MITSEWSQSGADPGLTVGGYGSLLVHFSSHDFRCRFPIFVLHFSIFALHPAIVDSRSSSLDFRFTFAVGVVVWWAGPARSFAHARLPTCM